MKNHPTTPTWVDLDRLAPADLRAAIAGSLAVLTPYARQVAELVAPIADLLGAAARVLDDALAELDGLDEAAWEVAWRALGADRLDLVLGALGATDDGPLTAKGWADVVELVAR